MNRIENKKMTKILCKLNEIGGISDQWEEVRVKRYGAGKIDSPYAYKRKFDLFLALHKNLSSD